MRSLYRSIRRHVALVAVLAVAAVSLGAWTSANFYSLNSQWSTTAQNARLSAISTQAVNGFVDFQSGTQPANANSAVTGTQLCSISLGATPFAAPSSGTMSNGSTYSCTGTAGAGGAGTAAGYVVMYKADHTTVLWMGSVGTASANVVIPSTTITTGLTVSIASGAFVITDNSAISGQ